MAPLPTPSTNAATTKRTRRDAGAGYAKGDDTRRAILTAALAEFGEHGYDRATTRGIARTAGVTLPSIAYYFGSKQGVYLACADEIVTRYLSGAAVMNSAANSAPSSKVSSATISKMSPAMVAAALDAACARADSHACRNLLKQLLRHVAQLVAGSDDALAWTSFVARELREQGPAFEVLYARLWQPGVRMLARLIAGIKGASEARDADTIDALMLISSLVAFYTGRVVSMRTLGWTGIGPAQLDDLFAATDRLADGVQADRDTPV